jgi:hypothetical protein
MLAVAHAATLAVARPLYQVSDEVVYLSSVQARALPGVVGLARDCVAPPSGTFPLIPVQLKPGFLQATAWQLRTLCAGGPWQDWSLAALRLLQSLSFGVLAACAWAIAYVLTGRATDAFLAGTIVAMHPVAAIYAGGVTPDAWANALAGATMLAATRMLVGVGRWWDTALIVLGPIASVAWKDTTTFLLGVPVLTLALQVGQARGRAVLASSRIVLLVTSGGLVAVAGLLWFRTPYALERPSAGGAVPLVVAIVGDLLPQLPGLLVTSWTAIGNFGASSLALSPVPVALGAILAGAGVTGACWRVATARPSPSRLAIACLWLASGLACVAQPSARQVLLDTQDIHQGRWLFPMLAPAAAFVACGLNQWTPDHRGLPAWGLGLVSVTWIALVDTMRHFWLTYPHVLNESALYLRGTGGAELAHGLVLSIVRHFVASMPRGLLLLLPLSLATLSAICFGLCWAMPRGVVHDRHADHR